MAKKDSRKRPRRGGTARPSEKSTSNAGKPSVRGLESQDPDDRAFVPLVLDKTVIALPTFDQFRKHPGGTYVHGVIIDLNLGYKGGRAEAKEWVLRALADILGKRPPKGQGVHVEKTKLTEQYVFARLTRPAIEELVRRDELPEPGDPQQRQGSTSHRAIYHIWPDFEIKGLINKSGSTVKADAARNAFGALGDGIVWAVMDSGIDGTHPHFRDQRNLELPAPLEHVDFTALSVPGAAPAGGGAGTNLALEDVYGHGTHVAGIIAGEMHGGPGKVIEASSRYRDEHGVTQDVVETLSAISGMAPRCKLLSLKVLDDDGRGEVSNLIAAIAKIQEFNGNGRFVRVQGVNMSVGYEFEPEWFACGQSPLCVEVNRLVKSGVVVVVAAGNTGFGWVAARGKAAPVTAGLDLTINDPGNADLAITVGATHRDKPHVYGVSYFSSKGPTGDGRMKPDLVAPGEKIISCDSSGRRAVLGQPVPGPTADPVHGYYREDSGTSMAAPHVSGVIAGFLSVRREFINRPENVKEIFTSTATDLKRAPYFQGAGLVDLMRAIQSV